MFYDGFLCLLVIGTILSFAFGTTSLSNISRVKECFSLLEWIAMISFTLDYCFKLYCISENPKFVGLKGKVLYLTQFMPIIDLLSFLPYWIAFVLGIENLVFVQFFYLVRIFRFERYTQAFTTFDDVFRLGFDFFIVTGAAALILWVFFSAVMYITERNNPDEEVASYYNTMPNSMWITLLNLSGEAPLCQYTPLGKVIEGIIAIFATGLFAVPIAVLCNGFTAVVDEEYEDTPDNEEKPRQTSYDINRGSVLQKIENQVFLFVNGKGSVLAFYFEISIYLLIFITIAIGILQTVHGYEDTLHSVEVIAVIVFTFEYVLRIVGAPADPEFGQENNAWLARLKFIF